METNTQTSSSSVKINYENSTVNAQKPNLRMLTSPKQPKISKVRQIVSMFNTKISQIIRRDVDDVGNFNKNQRQPAIISFLKPVSIPKICPESLSKPRTCYSKAPLTKSFIKVEEENNLSACFVPERVFSQLSVKEKAKFYSLFVEEINQKNEKFDVIRKNSTSIVNVRKTNQGKQINNEELKEETKPTAAATREIHRMEFLKKACAAIKHNEALCYSQQQKSNKCENVLTKETQINSKSRIDRQWEEAVANFKSQEAKPKAGTKPIPRQHKKKVTNFITTATSARKLSESESGVSTLTKHTSEDSHLENLENTTEKSENESDINKPLKPLRKKKLRKIAAVFSPTKGKIFQSTDSESDNKQVELKDKNSKLFMQTSAEEDETTDVEGPRLQDLIKSLNSPKKIKANYTLTINDLDTPLCTPRPSMNFVIHPLSSEFKGILKNQAAKFGSLDVEPKAEIPVPMLRKKRTSISNKNSLATTPNKSAQNEEERESRFSKLPKNYGKQPQRKGQEKANEKSVNVFDNGKRLNKDKFRRKENFSPVRYQSVLAESTDAGTAMEVSRLMTSCNSPRKIKTNYTLTLDESQTPLCTPRTSMNFPLYPLAGGMTNSVLQNFKFYDNFAEQDFERASNSTQETANAFSNANEFLSPKSHFDTEKLRRQTWAKQIFREDQALDKPQQTSANINFSEREEIFLDNANTKENTPATSLASLFEKNSQFWFKSGDIFVALDINFVDPARLRLLYDIFNQSSSNTKDLHLGIDDKELLMCGSLKDTNSKSNCLPYSKDCSHIWFSTGDLIIPFSGKHISQHKIQRIFHFIREAVEETDVLHFGVDEMEFSNVPAFRCQSAKFSVDNQNCKLLDLPTNENNDLEVCKKYACSLSLTTSVPNSNQSDNEKDNYDEYQPPFANNTMDLISFSNDESNIESYCATYENEPLDQLFGDNKTNQTQRPNEDVRLSKTFEFPQKSSTIKKENQCLSNTEQKPSNNSNTITTSNDFHITKDALDAFRGTPEYIEKLKDIVTHICIIGSSNNFRSCTVDQLDSYSYFLRRYADICLGCCTNHTDTVLNALADYKVNKN